MARRGAGIALGVSLAALALLVLWAGTREPAPAPSPSPPEASLAPEPPLSPERTGDISVRTLLREMVDLGALARLPSPPYRARQASSYDRRSVSPGDRDGWFANDDFIAPDRPNYVRVEQGRFGREVVLLDAEGPGALVRLWTATPTGTLRIYIDGESEPSVSERTERLLSGGARPLVPPLGHITARGYNLYFPFPFRARCKVTVDDVVGVDPFQGGPLEKFYYQLDWRAYDPSAAARIHPFGRGEYARAADEIRQAVRVLTSPGLSDRAAAGRAVRALEKSGDGGLRAELEAPAGGGVIRVLTVEAPGASGPSLRDAWLTLTFDGEPTVRVPLGDFFGSGPGLNPYVSLPFSVSKAGRLVSRFAMPFRERAVVALRSASGRPLEATASAAVEPLAFESDSLYFHAAWLPPSREKTRPYRDLGILHATGDGVYVGNVLEIENPEGAPWWGEGDEKVFVDGETFPAIFGTGTEDYYGYAWSSAERFESAFHSQTRADGPGFAGHFSMNRFHLLDAVPFRQSIAFDLELWHWSDTEVTVASVAYWYARPR